MANAILLEPMVPASISVFGSLLGFDFTAGALPAGATVARASTKYCCNASGSIVSLAANTLQTDYDPNSHAALGILVEPAATNLLLRSEQNDQAPWSSAAGATATADQIAAPDGNVTGDLVKSWNGSGNQFRAQNVTQAVATYVYSFWSKSKEYTRWYMGAVANGTFPAVIFDMATGTVVAAGAAAIASGMQAYANGWYRCWFVFANTTAGSRQQSAGPATSANNQAFVGDGVSGLYCWGGQIELLPANNLNIPSSYVPTTSATVTRAADVVTLNWASKGVSDGTYTVRYTFDDGTTQDVSTAIAGGNSTIPTNLNRPWIKAAQLLNSASPTLDLGVASNLLNDYAGVVAQTSCTIGATNQAKIQLDMGANVSVDTILVFGVELFPTNGNLIVNYATQAQGPFTGAFSTDTSGSAYAGSAPMTTGKGVSVWMLSAPVTARYFQIVYEAVVGGKSVRASRVAIGQRIQLQRNFSYGAGPGVKDLGSLDFSARAVLQRRTAKKLRTLTLTFSNLKRDEVQASVRPMLERQGNTGMVAVVTDPSVDADRQNKCYYGALVGDLNVVQRNAVGWETKVNVVSIF